MVEVGVVTWPTCGGGGAAEETTMISHLGSECPLAQVREVVRVAQEDAVTYHVTVHALKDEQGWEQEP